MVLNASAGVSTVREFHSRPSAARTSLTGSVSLVASLVHATSSVVSWPPADGFDFPMNPTRQESNLAVRPNPIVLHRRAWPTRRRSG